MTAYLFRIILDVTIKAKSQEEAQEIANNFGWNDMDVEVWSGETLYKGIDEGVDETQFMGIDEEEDE